MKKVYNNITRFEDKYYDAPRNFTHELIQEGFLDKDLVYNLCHVPTKSREGVYVDLYSVLQKECDYIVLQFERRYYAKDKILILETI